MRQTSVSGCIRVRATRNLSVAWAYFLETAIVSSLFLAAGGTSIEVSSVGMEGMIVVPIVLKSRSVPYRIVVQQPGTALRIKADVVRKEFDRCGAFHTSLLNYV